MYHGRIRTDFATKTENEWQASYFCHVQGALKCVTPCETEFIALLVGEKHPCVFLAARDDEALLL